MELKEVVSKYVKVEIDEKGLVEYAVLNHLIPFLEKKADETKTEIDDALVEKLKGLVSAYLAK